MNKKQYVIFLNGPSRAGKTTLAHALQSVSDLDFMHLSIDKIIGMMPHKHNDWITSYLPTAINQKKGFWFESIDGQRHDLKMGPLALKIADLIFEIAQIMLFAEHHLIIDEIVFNPQRYKQWQQILSPVTSCFVGVTCDPTILANREQQRGDRMIGSAIAQNDIIHTDKMYDLIIDTSYDHPDKMAQQILIHLFHQKPIFSSKTELL